MNDSIPPRLAAAERRAMQRAAFQRAEKRRKVISYTVALLVACAVSAGFAVAVHAYFSSDRQVTVTVTNEARVCSNDGSSVSCQYLVYTSGGTFKDTDSLASGKFSSSDLFGQLQNGHTYTFEVRGYRIPWMSEYPNILRIVSEH